MKALILMLKKKFRRMPGPRTGRRFEDPPGEAPGEVGCPFKSTEKGGVCRRGDMCHLPRPLAHEIAPSSLSSQRKAADPFSMAMMIINFKKFKSIPFSLKCEVCEGTRKEGTEGKPWAGGSAPQPPSQLCKCRAGGAIPVLIREAAPASTAASLQQPHRPGDVRPKPVTAPGL